MNPLKNSQYEYLEEHEMKDLADKVNEIVDWINSYQPEVCGNPNCDGDLKPVQGGHIHKSNPMQKPIKSMQIRELIRLLRKTFNNKCKTENWDCPNCRAWHLIAGLEWYLDVEEWGEKFNKNEKSSRTTFKKYNKGRNQADRF